MYNVILVIVGILLFGFSLYANMGFFGFVKKTRLWKWWVVLLLLQILFVLGYIAFAYWLVAGTGIVDMDILETVISSVFFFGAIFVYMTMSLIYSTVKDLVKEKDAIQRLETEKTDFLKEKEVELEKKVSERTIELDKKLTELDQMNKLMIGREIKMIELKKEIKELKSQGGSPLI